LLRIALIVALALALGFLAMINAPRFGGRYILRESYHDDVMTSGMTPRTTKTITILFIGNSLTAMNDLPAMLVNIAAADPGNPVQLSVKAFTNPGVDLHYMLTKTGALAWARANPADYVVLQEGSGWYEAPEWIAAARENARAWQTALRPLKSKLILFASWADLDGSAAYTDPNRCCYGKNFEEATGNSQRETGALAQELGMSIVRVGRAYHFAVQAGARDLYQADLHHPGYAGTYLAALTFYRYFTWRSGAESTYRPWGVSAAEAATLVQASSR
jgi:hypothetical protein